ncbi:MAG: ribonuclease Z [Flavobacteriaceae bacterium]|jgi:gamma-glutamyl phosphate reductase|nr:ribonuclease Z [Flavobacteriaceae bacterium]
MNLSKSINTLLFNISNENKFFNSIVELKKEIKLKNIIIDFNALSIEKFSEDLNYLFIESQNNKKSFVIVNSDFKSEYYNLNINVVPSLQEAIDIIEIEEIERDLGLL